MIPVDFVVQEREKDVWSAVASGERQKFMVFSVPLSVACCNFCAQYDDLVPEHARARGLRVDVIKTTRSARFFVKVMDIPFEDVPNTAAGLKLVSFGSLDLVVLKFAIASHAIEANRSPI